LSEWDLKPIYESKWKEAGFTKWEHFDCCTPEYGEDTPMARIY